MTKRIVGGGEYTYEVIYPFGKMPPISAGGRINHVAVDSKDRVYAFLRAEVPILVFDPDGNLLTTWGEGLFLAGHGIYISPSDEVFLGGIGVSGLRADEDEALARIGVQAMGL